MSLTAWGASGPWRERRGFDSIVQSVSGMAQAQGGADKPSLLPVSAIDYVSGYLMAFGAMLALERRAREGGSWLVRVALARVGKWIADLGAGRAGRRGRAAARDAGRTTRRNRGARRAHHSLASGARDVGDAAALGAAAGSARLPSAGLARPLTGLVGSLAGLSGPHTRL